MDTHSPVWTSLLHSILSIFGSLFGIFVFLFLFSYFSNLGSRLSRLRRKYTLSILPDAGGEWKIASRASPVILQMNFSGVIGADGLNLEAIETQLLEARLGELENRVKGLFLVFDSPGGAARDSDAIYRRLKAFKEKSKVPIYAYIDGMCASGGFFIACAADKIFASPSSVVGSVGVRLMMPYFNVHKVLERWNVGVKTFAEGKYKDHLNPFRPWKEEEDVDLKALLSQFYRRFVDIVVKERSQLSRDRLIEEYGARIYSAEEGEKLHFIDDGKSDYSEALSALLEAAGIKKGEPYQVVELVKKRRWIKEMMERSPLFTGAVHHRLQTKLSSPQALEGKIAYFFEPFER